VPGAHTELAQLSLGEVINGCEEKGVVGLLQVLSSLAVPVHKYKY
jgi:hypothetical protein